MKTRNLTFQEALELLKRGYIITRPRYTKNIGFVENLYGEKRLKWKGNNNFMLEDVDLDLQMVEAVDWMVVDEFCLTNKKCKVSDIEDTTEYVYRKIDIDNLHKLIKEDISNESKELHNENDNWNQILVKIYKIIKNRFGDL